MRRYKLGDGGGVLMKVSTKSELAKAARYSLAHWHALTRYVDDGRIEIDDSAAKRALRGVALGRGNHLFMGSDEGGHPINRIDELLPWRIGREAQQHEQTRKAA